MPAIQITRRLEFDAAHRVLHHESKCKHLHGHRYVADITVTAPGLDQLGRVIDFGVVKQFLGGWIDNNWDHNILLHPDDELSKLWRDYEAIVWTNCVSGHKVMVRNIFGGKEPYIFPTGVNPTAENIAKALFWEACGLLPSPITVTQVRIWETPNCYADYFA